MYQNQSNHTVLLKDIPEEIAGVIRKEHPNYTEMQAIDYADMLDYRLNIIEKQMKKQTTLIGRSDKRILKSIRDNEFVSKETIEDVQKLTIGQRTADSIAKFGGSWFFIITFITVLILWIFLNTSALLFEPFDPFPFILLNLALSCLAAIQAPLILMSQNRQEDHDREQSVNDYEVNLKSEIEVRLLHEKMDHLIFSEMKQLQDIQKLQMDYLKEIRSEVEKLKASKGIS